MNLNSVRGIIGMHHGEILTFTLVTSYPSLLDGENNLTRTIQTNVFSDGSSDVNSSEVETKPQCVGFPTVP